MNKDVLQIQVSQTSGGALTIAPSGTSVSSISFKRVGN